MQDATLRIRQHQKDDRDNPFVHPMFPARMVARGWGHGGYTWAAVTDDGALLCPACVCQEWAKIVRATRGRISDGWQVVWYTHSGEWESPEYCAHCGREMNDHA